jgi:RNA polymerase sigma-70 factor (ECF subfamily)
VNEDNQQKDMLTHKVLDLLPLKYKTVLVLKFMENMSYEEISDVLKIPEGTVATWINRAKKKFTEMASDKHISFFN